MDRLYGEMGDDTVYGGKGKSTKEGYSLDLRSGFKGGETYDR